MASSLRILLAIAISSFYTCVYAQTASCPPNIDFEKGNLSNWQLFTGSCCPINTPSMSGAVATRHTLVSGTAIDPYGNFPVVAPNSGVFSFRLGNDQIGAEAERARFFVKVPASGGTSNFYLVFRYAVVFEDPQHATADQPRFEVNAYDSATGTPIPCAQFSFVSTASLPGFAASTKPGTGGATVYYKPWAQASLNLSGNAGKTIALDFASGDCALGGHFGYGYIDINCGLYEATALLCDNSSNNIKLIAPPGFQTYRWMDSAMTTLYGTTQNVTISKPPVNTTFAVILTPYAGFGCPDTLYVYTKLAGLTINATNDSSFCKNVGNPYQLSLTSGAVGNAAPLTYAWAPATGLSCTNCANPTATFSNSINYSVTVTDTNGCKVTDTTRLTIIPTISVSIAKPKDSVCQYQDMEFSNVGNNPPETHYGWTVDTAGNISQGGGTSKITANWGTPGLKKVKLRGSIGKCDNVDSVFVYVKPGPFASFEISHDVCVNDPVTMTPKQQDASYKWSLDGPVISDNTYTGPFKLSWNTSGIKYLSLLLSTKNGCTSEYKYSMVVHDYPTAAIKDLNSQQCVGDTIKMQAARDSSYNYDWSPSNYFIDNNSDTVHMRVAGTGFIFLRAFNKWGCTDFDTSFISTGACCNAILPDAFTPNGDGRNDVFRVVTGGEHQVLMFVVKNRWGKTLFTTTDQYTGWDGTYHNQKQDYGMYFYFLKYKCQDGTELEKKGSFLLIR